MKSVASLLFSAVALLVATTACTDKNAYTLNGTVADSELNGSEIYLKEMNVDGKTFNNLDTAIVENGVFVFKGVSTSPAGVVRFVSPAKNEKISQLVVLEPGTIAVTLDSVSTVKGTPQNDKYQEYTAKKATVREKLGAIRNNYKELSDKGEMTDEKAEAIGQEYDAISNEFGTYAFGYITENIASPLSEYVLMENLPLLSEEQQGEVFAKLAPEHKNFERLKRAEARLETIKKTAVGQQFTDIKGNTPEGTPAALSDYAGKGNVVLVDFWASWCPPCRKEMPTVVDIYKKYKSKGFEIVGISLDDDQEAWVQGIKDLNITWPQISDLKGWESELSTAYGINSIPHTVLIDKDGKIVARGFSAHELASKLDELLK